jgi:hypothetical protein
MKYFARNRTRPYDTLFYNERKLWRWLQRLLHNSSRLSKRINVVLLRNLNSVMVDMIIFVTMQFLPVSQKIFSKPTKHFYFPSISV